MTAVLASDTHKPRSMTALAPRHSCFINRRGVQTFRLELKKTLAGSVSILKLWR